MSIATRTLPAWFTPVKWRWVTNANGELTEIGEDLAEWYGMTPDAVCRAGLTLIHPEDQPEAIRRFRAALYMREEHFVEPRTIRGDGVWVRVTVRGKPVVEGGKFVGFWGLTVPFGLF